MSEKITTIRLYGVLGSKFGRVHRMAVANAAEAVRALSCQLKGFDSFLTQSKDKGLTYAVFYGDKNLSEDDLRSPNGGADIRFAPIIIGSKKKGVLQTILGVVLIVVGAVLSAYGYGAVGQPMISAGIGMVVGGVMQLLAPTPKGNGSQDSVTNQPSFSFNGPINTQAQGNPVPVLYGELIVGSAVLSAGIEAETVYVPDNTGIIGGGAAGGGYKTWLEDYVI